MTPAIITPAWVWDSEIQPPKAGDTACLLPRIAVTTPVTQKNNTRAFQPPAQDSHTLTHAADARWGRNIPRGPDTATGPDGHREHEAQTAGKQTANTFFGKIQKRASKLPIFSTC